MRAERKRSTAKAPAWRSKRGRQAWVVNAFKAFGRHCARNQIRVLIIDSFVMTTLFYPALALLLQRKFPPLRPPMGESLATQPEHPLSLLSTPILDSFFPLPPPLLPAAQHRWFFDNQDFVDVWIVDRADSLLQQSMALGSELSHHALVFGSTVAWTNVGAVLDSDQGRAQVDKEADASKAILQAAQDVSTAIGGSWTCLPDPNDPEACWSERTPAIRQTSPFDLDTLSVYFARRDDRAPEDKLEHALKAFQRDWAERLNELGKEIGAEVFLDRPGQRRRDSMGLVWSVHPVSATLQQDVSRDSAPSASTVPRGIIILFSALLGWLLYLLARATNVHNRFGLAFTGIVELTCSTVMSYSVLTLLQAAGLGWRPVEAALAGPGVPWYILPFVILVVGVENMSALTRAVHSIPVSESVPDRIGLGLAKVGPKLFMTSITDIAVLAVVGLVVQLRPVREFCTFAAVLIFVDWWMLHTFYLTVLSIDCQRLELADVLSQNRKRSLQDNAAGPAGRPSISRASLVSPAERLEHTAKTSFQRLWMYVKRARRARIGSLLLFLILLTILFYVNESHRLRTTSLPGLYGYRGDQGYQQNESLQSTTSTANVTGLILPHPWGLVNPTHKTRVALAHMPPITLVLPSKGHLVSPEEFKILATRTVRSWLPRLTPLFHLVKVVLLPQWITAFLLYLLLLWLLKDTQLLDAQRNRPSIADKRSKTQRKAAMGQASRLAGTTAGMTTAFSAAISTLDVSEITYLDDLLLAQTSTTDVQVMSSDSDRVTPVHRLAAGHIDCSASSSDAKFWATADSTGKITLYRRHEQAIVPRQLVNTQATRIAGLTIRWVDVVAQQDPFLGENLRKDIQRAPEVLTARQDGSIWSHDLTGAERQVLNIELGEHTAFSTWRDRTLVTCTSQTGRLLIYDVTKQDASLLAALDVSSSGQGLLPGCKVFALAGNADAPAFALLGWEDESMQLWHLDSASISASCRPDCLAEETVVLDRIEISAPMPAGSTCPRCRSPAATHYNILWSTKVRLHAATLTLTARSDTCRCHLVRSPRTALLGAENSLAEGFAFVGRSPRKPSNAGGVRSALVPPPPGRPQSPGSDHPATSAEGSPKANEPENFTPQATFGNIQSFAIDRGGWCLLHDGSLAAAIDRESASARSHQSRNWQVSLLDLTRPSDAADFSETVSLDIQPELNGASLAAGNHLTPDPRQAVDRTRARRLSALRGDSNLERPIMKELFQPISFARLTAVTSLGAGRIAFGMGNRVGVVTISRPAATSDYEGNVNARRWSSAVSPPRFAAGQNNLLAATGPPKEKAD